MNTINERLHDANNEGGGTHVYQEQQCEINLQNALSYAEEEKYTRRVDAQIVQLYGLQRAYDQRLAFALIDRRLSPPSLATVKKAAATLELKKISLATRLSEGKAHEGNYDSQTMAVIAQRLAYLGSFPETSPLLNGYIVDSAPEENTYVIPPGVGSVVREAISLSPHSTPIIGFKAQQTQNGFEIHSLLTHTNDGITQIVVGSNEEKRQEIAASKTAKRIIIAVEGDIAGHSLRALETARGLRRLGYEPMIVGNGTYIAPFDEEGFKRLPPFSDKRDAERERIITQARGEGKGVFFWDYRTVVRRGNLLKEHLREHVQKGLDLVVNDMNPIADIALTHLQQETGNQSPSFSETHDIRLSAGRSLRTVKIMGLPLGELVYQFNESHVAKMIDHNNIRYEISHFLLDKAADWVMGLPLFLYDHLHGPGSKHRSKFTDYIYGRDGTLRFCFSPESEDPKVTNVGLQADLGNSVRQEWEAAIPTGKPFILNAQGSTYNKAAWELVRSTLSNNPDSFSVHATGRKEDSPLPLLKNGEVVGYQVGYAPAYRLSKDADLLINHGGFGTISQWLLATTGRLNEHKAHLDELIKADATADAISNYLSHGKSLPRSISICNTFEQENNALSLQEAGGEEVCTVITADNLTRASDPQAKLTELIESKQRQPLTNKEIKFWLDLVDFLSETNGPAHSALVLERVMVSGLNR